jgi:hypothetical protein
MRTNPWRASAIAIAMAGMFPLAVHAADDTAALRKEVEQLRQELSELRALVKSQGQTAATKEEVTAVKAEVARVAEQPAPAPETNSRFLVTGYGVLGYGNRQDASGSFGMAGFNPIFLYQYKDLLLFQAELETGINADGSTSVGLEYAEGNVFVNDYLSLFGGKVLTPLGYFIRNLHPAWINKFASKPPGFGVEGGAAPESDVGVGARGAFAVNETARANYAAYVGNGPRLELNEAGDEIEGVEAEGATSNPGGRMFFGGRVGVLPIPGLELGLSGGTGKTAVEGEARRNYSVAGADLSFKRGPIDLHAEYIQQRVGNLSSSAAPEGGTWKAWYAQLAYRISTTPWEPVVRYGDFTTPHPDQDLRQWGIGLNYWLTPSAVAKVAYEFNQGEPGTKNNADLFLVQFSYGF